MPVSTLEPGEVIEELLTSLGRLPAAIAGSVVAAHVYDMPLMEQSDLDVFCYSDSALITAIERLSQYGYSLDDRFSRVKERWLKFGLKTWHTNSVKLIAPDELNNMEINLVYKTADKVPASSLAAVLEAFDFGLLGTGWDLSDGKFRDMRSFMFPGLDITGPLPFMPNKQHAWQNGFISQYNGLREAGRYAKYYSYGHDMSLLKATMIQGYHAVAEYLVERGDPDRILLAQIYTTIATHIEFDNIDELLKANKQILSVDALDQIMEALE